MTPNLLYNCVTLLAGIQLCCFSACSRREMAGLEEMLCSDWQVGGNTRLDNICTLPDFLSKIIPTRLPSSPQNPLFAPHAMMSESPSHSKQHYLPCSSNSLTNPHFRPCHVSHPTCHDCHPVFLTMFTAVERVFYPFTRGNTVSIDPPLTSLSDVLTAQLAPFILPT